MNLSDATALLMQLARIAVGGIGIYLMIKGQVALGGTLFSASGLSAANDVFKVKKDTAMAVAAVQTTATLTVHAPLPADQPQ